MKQPRRPGEAAILSEEREKGLKRVGSKLKGSIYITNLTPGALIRKNENNRDCVEENLSYGSGTKKSNPGDGQRSKAIQSVGTESNRGKKRT